MLVVYVVVIFVNAFICCLIAVELASVKGHDTVKWGWYGFLFGPIGVLGAVGLPDRDKVYARSTDNISVEELGGRVVRDDHGEVVRISLTNSRITDAELGQLEELTGLQTLDLGGTKISNAGLAHLTDLSNLVTLSLHSTRITDAGLLHLKGLIGLKTLWLGGTTVSDNGLKHLAGLANLQSIGLEDTKTTGEGIAELRRALPQCQVSKAI